VLTTVLAALVAAAVALLSRSAEGSVGVCIRFSEERVLTHCLIECMDAIKSKMRDVVVKTRAIAVSRRRQGQGSKDHDVARSGKIPFGNIMVW